MSWRWYLVTIDHSRVFLEEHETLEVAKLRMLSPWKRKCGSCYYQFVLDMSCVKLSQICLFS